MLTVHVRRYTKAPAELVLDSPVTPERFTLHESGDDFLDVTEGTSLTVRQSRA